jgi:hypothetical protein
MWKEKLFKNADKEKEEKKKLLLDRCNLQGRQNVQYAFEADAELDDGFVIFSHDV